MANRKDYELLKKSYHLSKDDKEKLYEMPLVYQSTSQERTMDGTLMELFINPFYRIKQYLVETIGFPLVYLIEDKQFSAYMMIDMGNDNIYGRLLSFKNDKGYTPVMFTCSFTSEGTASIIDKVDNVDNEEMLKNVASLMADFVKFVTTALDNKMYPVSVSVPHSKRHSKRTQWANNKGLSIVFMNSLPVDRSKQEHKGGSHASPCAHNRKGHYRVLKDKTIFIAPMWIGARESVVTGKTYTVLPIIKEI